MKIVVMCPDEAVGGLNKQVFGNLVKTLEYPIAVFFAPTQDELMDKIAAQKKFAAKQRFEFLGAKESPDLAEEEFELFFVAASQYTLRVSTLMIVVSEQALAMLIKRSTGSENALFAEPVGPGSFCVLD